MFMHSVVIFLPVQKDSSQSKIWMLKNKQENMN